MAAYGGTSRQGIHMTWIKQGRIFHLEPAPNRSTHCQVPTPYVMEDKIRVYYSCRNNGKSFIAYFDLAKDLKTILKVHEQPIMSHGKPGMFDADGVMPSCVIENKGELWLYYIGWNELKNTARYQNEIGLAVSKDGGDTFESMFEGPIMGRTKDEPGLAVMPFVFEDDGIFKMYYQSGTGWHLIDGQHEPTYVIKYSQSKNGIKWKRSLEECIPSLFPLQAISRPAVVSNGGDIDMLFCSRGSKSYRGGAGSYRIFSAHSNDGINFERKNEPSLEFGCDGEFDSEMQAYPSVVKVDGKHVMFYNGNGFGQTGIGVAVWS